MTLIKIPATSRENGRQMAKQRSFHRRGCRSQWLPSHLARRDGQAAGSRFPAPAHSMHKRNCELLAPLASERNGPRA